MVKTPPFHGGNTGSNPVRATSRFLATPPIQGDVMFMGTVAWHPPTPKKVVVMFEKVTIEGIGTFYVIRRNKFTGAYMCSKKNPKKEIITERDLFPFDPLLCGYPTTFYRRTATLK